MYHGDEHVALAAQLVCLFKTQFKALGLAQVYLVVLLGVVGTARARPPARTAYHHVFKLYAVVLQEEEGIVGRPVAQFGYAVPPIVVVAADEHLFARKGCKAVYIEQPLLKRDAPAYVAANEHDIFGRHLFAPVGTDFFEVPLPPLAKDIHGFGVYAREVQIAYGKYIHIYIMISYGAQF